MSLTAIDFVKFVPSCRSASSSCVLVFGFVVALAGCNPTHAYKVDGRVEGFGDDGRTIIVTHGDIPGLMPGMTMPFKASNPSEIDGLIAGNHISFRLSVSSDSSWISEVRVLESAAPFAGEVRTRVHGTELIGLLPGERIDPLVLVNESGENELLFDSDSSAVVLIDFIYTRCPLPDFCPRLSAKFAELQQMILDGSVDGIRLASVTVDPDYDTPSVLDKYGRRYAAEPAVWRFYTGRRSALDSLNTLLGISLFESPDQPIAHPLVSAIIDSNGVLRRIERDASWTAAEFFAEASRYASGIPVR